MGWALFVQELDDAHKHLGKLIADIQSDPGYDDGNLRVDLGHVLAHLNRSWARRNRSDDLSDEEWEEAREFPNDLHPIA
jgi:hypothetical protein